MVAAPQRGLWPQPNRKFEIRIALVRNKLTIRMSKDRNGQRGNCDHCRQTTNQRFWSFQFLSFEFVSYWVLRISDVEHARAVRASCTLKPWSGRRPCGLRSLAHVSLRYSTTLGCPSFFPRRGIPVSGRPGAALPSVLHRSHLVSVSVVANVDTADRQLDLKESPR